MPKWSRESEGCSRCKTTMPGEARMKRAGCPQSKRHSFISSVTGRALAGTPPGNYQSHGEKMKKLGPGIYVDDDQQMHFLPREFAAALGIRCTPQNEAEIIEIFVSITRERYPGLPVFELPGAHCG